MYLAGSHQTAGWPWLSSPDLLCSFSLGLGTVPSLPCCQHQLLIHLSLWSSSLLQLPDTSVRWSSDKILPLFWNCSQFMMNVHSSYLCYPIKVIKKSAFPPLPMVPRMARSILQNIIETLVFSFLVCSNVLPFVNSTGAPQPVTPSQHFLGAYPDSSRGFAT